MRFTLIIIFLVCGCRSNSDAQTASITIFAAASLTDILHELTRRFEAREPGFTVHTHLGPTSLLAKQIQQGAPADLFMAASPMWAEYLREQDLTLDLEMKIARNTLVVLGAPALNPVRNVSELYMAHRIAMADPSHVPAGVYGKEALQCAGVWDIVEKAVIPVLDVRAALISVSSGAADLAIVYGSDAALAPDLQFMFEISGLCAPQIIYVISAVRGTPFPEVVDRFIHFTVDAAQQDLWTRFGFNPL